MRIESDQNKEYGESMSLNHTTKVKLVPDDKPEPHMPRT